MGFLDTPSCSGVPCAGVANSGLGDSANSGEGVAALGVILSTSGL